ncbi:MAG TPA: diguanylate cyclase [Actinomycetota bacterium]|nr:diguanylate cyclase [Actinomycetota bacterium]
MSLQRKLTLFFVTIVMLPLVAAAFIVQRVISDEVGERAVLTMRPTLDATMALYNDDLAQLEQRVRSSISQPGKLSAALESSDRAELKKYLQARLGASSNLDFLLIQRDRSILAYVANEPRFLSGVPVPNAFEVAAAKEGSGKGFVRSRAVPLEVAGAGPIAQISGGMWVDRELLAAGWRSIVGLSVVADGDVLASTASVPGPVRINVARTGPFEASIGGPVIAVARPLEGEMSIVASTPSGPIDSASGRVITAMLILLLFALTVTTVLAYVLARAITQPLDELAEGAMAISEGRFDHQIPVRSKDEVGQLAQAFNKMTSHLSTTISELSWSRDQLRKSIQRVGDTLRSTHDMKQLLESVLATAADAVQAEAAVFWAFTPTREELHPSISRGTEIDPLVRVGVGEGAVGLVAERATPVLIPNQAAGGPRFSRYEPRFPVAVAVPVYSQDKIRGVLALYREDPRKHFTEQDVEMVTFLAEQGGTAIENVLLHEEAQRLSITDGLTGIWNRRYFQMQFRQVLATATRFDRTFSILLLDLDHFKRVNDTYGHRRGDEILVEFSQRVTTMVREVDTFARYGGEEFACLLTETEMSGALTTAEKIREAVRREAFGEGEEPQLHLTVSIGVATYPDHGDSFVSLIEAADKALYRAKQTGRDQVCVAERLRLAT